MKDKVTITCDKSRLDLEYRELAEDDLEMVKEIYDHYILNSVATFHTEQISIGELKEFIPIGHPKYKSFLILDDGIVCGYCYMAPYKKRQAYDRSAEITIYLKPAYSGKGIGYQVIHKLEDVAVGKGIKVLLGVITGENLASIRLFSACGFEKCAHFKQVGEKFGKILDVVVFQKILDCHQ